MSAEAKGVYVALGGAPAILSTLIVGPVVDASHGTHGQVVLG